MESTEGLHSGSRQGVAEVKGVLIYRVNALSLLYRIFLLPIAPDTEPITEQTHDFHGSAIGRKERETRGRERHFSNDSNIFSFIGMHVYILYCLNLIQST